MTFLPIAERELRIRARRPGTFFLRCIAATIALGFAIMMLTLAGFSPRKSGAGAFLTLTTLTWLYCLYEGLRNTTDCLSEEKRAGTLGFLFLTDLKGYDVVIGKLLATSLSSFYALFAILPAIGFPLLSGGVTAGEFWRAVLVLIVTLFFSLSVGMLVSSASRSERRAWGASLGIVFFLSAIPPLILSIPFVPGQVVSWCSPTVAFWRITETRYAAGPWEFWTAVGGVHLLSWSCLVAASIILPHAWQERPTIPTRRFFLPVEAPRRARLLETNPVSWLVSRDEGIRVYLWALIAVFAAGFFAIWAITGFAAPLLFAFAGCIFILHFLLATRVAFHVCHTFVDARDTGLLELLLASPLKATEIIDGFRAAFLRLFRGPVLLLLWIEGVIAGFYFLMGTETTTAAIALLLIAALAVAFVMDLHAVGTFGMWVSLTARKPSQAFNKTVLMVMVVPLALFCCQPAYLVKNFIFFSYKSSLYLHFRRLITERSASAVLGPK